jgi:ABC-type uncharacterized transport system ATPase subunit
MRHLIRSPADEGGDGGMTIFVSRLLLSENEHICDHLIKISDGKTLFEGEVAQLRAARGEELILRPESDSSLASLVALVVLLRSAVLALLAGPAYLISTGYLAVVAVLTAHTFEHRDVTA